MSAPPTAPTFTLFVSCVDGKPVTRFRLGGGTSGLFGARRAEGSRAFVYDEQQVIAITAAEVEAFGRTYERAIRDGHLTRRTEDEWRAWVAGQKDREAAELARLEEEQRVASAAQQEQPAAPAGGTPS